MAIKRRSFSAQFKFKVALEAVKGVKTLSKLASEHGVHPNQIGQWKQQLIKEGAEIFSHNSKDQQNGQEVEADLFEQIGRFKMELEWLKKKSPDKHKLVDPAHPGSRPEVVRGERVCPEEKSSARSCAGNGLLWIFRMLHRQPEFRHLERESTASISRSRSFPGSRG